MILWLSMALLWPLNLFGLAVLRLALLVAKPTEPRRSLGDVLTAIASAAINGYWSLALDLSRKDAP